MSASARAFVCGDDPGPAGPVQLGGTRGGALVAVTTPPALSGETCSDLRWYWWAILGLNQ